MKANSQHSLTRRGYVLPFLLFFALILALVAPSTHVTMAQGGATPPSRPTPGPGRPQPGPGREPPPAPSVPGGGPEATVVPPVLPTGGGAASANTTLLIIGLAFILAGVTLSFIGRPHRR
jgi:hypothetical protein